jgi:hypothetical protein
VPVPISARRSAKVEMRVIELHADTWDTAMDFVAALKVAIGAPIGTGTARTHSWIR